MPRRWPRQQVRKRIERAHAEIERRADALARMRRRRRVAVRHRRRPLRQRPLAVDRLAHRVDDAAEPGRRGRTWLAALAITARQPRRTPSSAGERHHHGVVAGEADHLARDETVAAGFDHDAGADRHRMNGAGDLDHQAAHADHAAINIDAVDIADLLGERLHCENLKFPRFWGRPLTSCLPASLIIASLSLVTESARPSEGRSSRESWLGPALNVELERTGYKKLLRRNILGRFEKNCTERACGAESDFVNHMSSGSESVVQRRFECRKCGRPDARSGDYRGLACAYC